jgi:hypothetical protein
MPIALVECWGFWRGAARTADHAGNAEVVTLRGRRAARYYLAVVTAQAPVPGWPVAVGQGEANRWTRPTTPLLASAAMRRHLG